MVQRVLLGKANTKRGGSSVYGLWVSKPTKNVLSCEDEELLFDSTKPRHAQILASGTSNGSSFTVETKTNKRVMVFIGGHTNEYSSFGTVGTNSSIPATQTVSSNTATITIPNNVKYIVTNIEAD
tara:strand:+ start:481 stop:855 length:375 start_codon:yes stop_codon:yes gene_type:complete